MSADTALYIGEAGNCLANGTPLIPGVTLANVPQGEAQASDLWEPVPDTPADSQPPSIFDGGAPSSVTLGALDGGAS